MNGELWYDVLVIGGGGAALRAAISAWSQGAHTALLSKGVAGKSGATYYSVAEVGAFNVPDGAMDPEDNPESFYEDIVTAALDTADTSLCRVLAENAESALQYLEKISDGAVFSKEDGHFKVYQACFSTRPRSHVVENHFKPILKALTQELKKTDIAVLNGLQAVDLLVKDGCAAGAYAIDENGNPVVLHAKSVILAAGGASQLFRRNMYPADITGDGYAMAYRAGAKMANMEFIQAGIGVAHPFINLFGNYLWEANPEIVNAAGEPILKKYMPENVTEREILQAKTHFPFSTRDSSRFIEIAVQSECNLGHGTEHGNMLLHFRNTDFESLFRRNPMFASMWKITYNWHRERGIDLYRDAVEISCFAHAINGGIWINEQAESSIPGLFAAGEIAAGPHGADRLGGNMSVACQVFGEIAGRNAARVAKQQSAYQDVSQESERISDHIAKLRTGSTCDCDAMLTELQEQSDKYLLIIRKEAGLQTYLQFLSQLQSEIAKGGGENHICRLLQLENLITTGGLIAEAALARKESRGSHYRVDYPTISPEFAHPIFLQKDFKEGA